MFKSEFPWYKAGWVLYIQESPGSNALCLCRQNVEHINSTKASRGNSKMDSPFLLQTFLDAATQIAIIATDDQGVISVFNSGAENLLGRSAKDLVGKATPLAFHEPTELQLRARDLLNTLGRMVSGFEAVVALTCETGHEVRDWTYVHADGTHIPVRLSVSPITCAQGEISGYLGMAMDIREERRALKEAGETGQRLESILSTAVDGIFTVNESGDILSANPAASRIFGYQAEELLGKPVTILMPEPYKSEHHGYMQQYMRTGRPKIIGKPGREVEGLRKDGSLVPLELAVSDIWLGEIFIFVGILRDISDRKAAEQALLETNRQLEERQKLLERDMDAAGEIQRQLLPKTLPFPEKLEIAWRFEPSIAVGGDIFNVIPLGSNSVGIYILDVSGHGVDSALVAVSVSQQLRPENGLVQWTGEADDPALATPPCQVVQRLDAAFPVERFDKFMTLTYLVLDTDSGMIRYCNAGHPPPLLIRADGEVVLLEEGGTIIGLGGITPFSEGMDRLGAGDTLLFYTDGVIEYEGSQDEPFGQERLVQEVNDLQGHKVESLLDSLLLRLYRYGDFAEPSDDITLLGIRLTRT
ncbi:MAG: PAS domain S-box protein [Desulfovibrio sp.]|nr:MAG: PAS domain S-box protein [Desulfovibrio sp.]